MGKKRCSEESSTRCSKKILNKKDMLKDHYETRKDISKKHKKRCCAKQKTNGDEKRYKDSCRYPYAGSFSKSLSHSKCTGSLDSNGKESYKYLVKALETGNKKDFNKIKLSDGCTQKLVDPRAAFYVNLNGTYQPCIQSPVPPAVASKEHAVEMIELYAMEITRDVPFYDWKANAKINKVLCFLNQPEVLRCFKGPTKDNKVTFNTLFRGTGPRTQYGPYISQLLYCDIPYGSQTIQQTYKCAVDKEIYDPNADPKGLSGAPVNFGVDPKGMICIQNGCMDCVFNITDDRFCKEMDVIKEKYLYKPSCLAEMVHKDALFQHYYNAAQILLNLKAPVDPILSQPHYASNFTSMGGPADILHHVATVSGIALKHAWYHKWCVHKRLRPEATSLLVQNGKICKTPNFDLIHNILMGNSILDCIKDIHKDCYNVDDSYLLSQVYPEGSPCHPSYPAGHAVVAGACITVMKILFNGRCKWNDLIKEVLISIDGESLTDYNGTDTNMMTVNSELNKLGSNISLGRNWAGVHYRSDSDYGMMIGEKVAIEYMSDVLACYDQVDSCMFLTLERLDGTTYNIEPTIDK
jgi:hypothetical protein